MFRVLQRTFETRIRKLEIVSTKLRDAVFIIYIVYQMFDNYVQSDDTTSFVSYTSCAKKPVFTPETVTGASN